MGLFSTSHLPDTKVAHYFQSMTSTTEAFLADDAPATEGDICMFSFTHLHHRNETMKDWSAFNLVTVPSYED